MTLGFDLMSKKILISNILSIHKKKEVQINEYFSDHIKDALQQQNATEYTHGYGVPPVS